MLAGGCTARPHRCCTEWRQRRSWAEAKHPRSIQSATCSGQTGMELKRSICQHGGQGEGKGVAREGRGLGEEQQRSASQQRRIWRPSRVGSDVWSVGCAALLCGPPALWWTARTVSLHLTSVGVMAVADGTTAASLVADVRHWLSVGWG
jgi:hypothetical protein